MIVSESDLIFRFVCGFLLIMQTVGRLWMTRNTPSSTNSRFYHKLREQFLVRLAGIAVLLAYLYVFLPDTKYCDYFIPVTLRWIGAVLMLAGNSLFFAAHSALGRQWSAELEIQPEHHLIERGIYRWIRHPMYTSFLVFGIGLLPFGQFLWMCLFYCYIYYDYHPVTCRRSYASRRIW